MKQRFVIGSIGVLIAGISLASTEVAAQFGGGGGGMTPAAIKEAESKPTPKRTNGAPDFTGLWVATRARDANPPAALDQASGNYTNVLRSRTGTAVDFERDAGVRQRVFPRESRPWYRPSQWQQVQFNDIHGHSLQAPDPDFLCMPAGVPRIGIPQEIVQTDRHMIFIYPLHLRRIYIDGREHPPEAQWLGTWFGHSVGRWEGDTLVVETTNLLEESAFGGASERLKITERFRPTSRNVIEWSATFEDPGTWVRPWTFGMRLTRDESQPLFEYACHEGNYGFGGILRGARTQDQDRLLKK
jgi:hypothetical protein